MIAWKKVTISDVADEVTVGHVGPMASEYVDKGIPFLRSLNIEPFNIKYDGVKFITASFHKRLQKSSLRPGDVVIVRTGKPGTCAVIPDWLLEANCSDVVIVRCSERVRPRFLCYVVNSVAGHHISSHIVGAVQQHFNVGSARTLEFLLPSIEGQDAILAILGALDDKIDLNRRTNETLEAMARALFRDWFVDFGPTRAKMAGKTPYLAPELWELFPDKLDDEGKPEGWHRVLLNDLISVTKGRSYKSSELQESQTALVTLKSFMRGGGYRHDGLKAFTGKYHDDQIVSPGDLIVALTDVTQAADVIGKPAIVVHDQKYKTLVASLDVGIIRKKTELTGMSFIYQILLSEEFQNHAYSYTSGTTVLHLNKEAIPSFEVCIPPQKLGAFLENSLDTMKEKVISNFKEINSLAQLRDLLLPKLMSGEISIRDAEKMVEDAA